MSASPNNYCTDTSILPSNVLSLQHIDFFNLIKNLTSDTIVDLLRIQEIRSVRIFMLVPLRDIIEILNADSGLLDQIRNQCGFRLKNGDFFIKAGVNASLRYLRELFATKIKEHYYPNNKNDDNASISSDDIVPIGQKRAASVPSNEQITNKRIRK